MENNKCWQECGEIRKLEPSKTAGKNVEWCTAVVENSLVIIQTTTITTELLYDSYCTPKYILKRFANKCSNKTSIWMFIAVLFTKAKRWEQPQYLSTNEWINRIRSLCEMESSSVTKRVKYWYMLQRPWTLTVLF